MPRMAETERQRQYTSILHHLDAYFGDRRRIYHTDDKTSARALGFCYRTLWGRKQDPGTFKLSELQEMANAMNISLPSLLGYEDMRKTTVPGRRS